MQALYLPGERVLVLDWEQYPRERSEVDLRGNRLLAELLDFLGIAQLEDPAAYEADFGQLPEPELRLDQDSTACQ